MSQGYYCCDKTSMSQKQRGWGRLNFSLQLCGLNLLLREVKGRNSAGTWRHQLKQGPWRNAAFLPAPHGLLSLLTCNTQDHPVALPTVNLKTGQSVGGHFLNQCSLFSNDSDLYKVDKKDKRKKDRKRKKVNEDKVSEQSQQRPRRRDRK